MKILITGTAGFIGFHLVHKLINEGHSIVGLDNINDYYAVSLKYARLAESGIAREEIVPGKLVQSKLLNDYRFIKLDLTDLEQLNHLFEQEKFNVVVNLAAQAGVRYSLENPHSYVQSNLVGFVNILECCRHHTVEHLVYASSSSVYGMNAKIPFNEEDRTDAPVSLYAATKKSNELLAHTYSHLYRLPTTGLRFFTVYGPWGRPDMAPMLFAKAITENKPIKVFNGGDMSRDFTYIDDIVEGICCTINNPPALKDDATPPYRVLNIGNGAPVSLMEFIATLEKALGATAQKEMYPMQQGDVPRTWADISMLKKTGYNSTTDIAHGIKQFVEWYEKYNII